MTDKTTIGALTAVELLELYRTRQLSPVEVTSDVLDRIATHNPAVNAYCHVDREGALREAKASEARWQRGQPCGTLDGVPSSIKDLTLTSGMPTRKGSRTTSADGPWDIDAPFTSFMRREGAILVGKTTTPEFGWKGVTDNLLYGVTRNPWDTNLTAGGSSGGAAAAAALNLGVLHQGSDAGGSIRIPCAFTGTFGIKPTFGYIPQWPTSAMTVLSHLGPMTRTVEDAVLMLNAVAHPDARDGLVGAARQSPWLNSTDRLDGVRICFSANFGYVEVDPAIQIVIHQAVQRLVQLGAIVEAADPGFDDPQDTFNTLWFVGAARVARQLSPHQRTLLDPGFAEIADLGESISLSDYTDALAARVDLVAKMASFHERYDLLVSPMMPITAFAAGHNAPPGSSYNKWVDWTPFSYPFNLTQQPAASLPCGFTPDGLPVGLQVVATRFADEKVLQACRAYEKRWPNEFLSAPISRQ